MFCKGCGKEIPDGSQFCPSCGINLCGDVQTPLMPEYTQKKKASVGKKILTVSIIGVVAVAVLFMGLVVIGLLSETDYIQLVKDGSLVKYDYGKTIGDALDNWFEGNVKWDSYELYDTVYVTAKGNVSYMTEAYDSYEEFTFMIVDDNHFTFEGAYDIDGNPIFSQSQSARVDIYTGLMSMFGMDLHEAAIKAAFGDEKSLEGFKGKKENSGDNPEAENNDDYLDSYEEESYETAGEWEDTEEMYEEITRDEYILPDSDSRIIYKYELADLTKDEVRIARNEIYARHGAIFGDEQLQDYFEGCTWYEGTIDVSDITDSMITSIEKENLDMIVSYEKEMGYR